MTFSDQSRDSENGAFSSLASLLEEVHNHKSSDQLVRNMSSSKECDPENIRPVECGGKPCPDLCSSTPGPGSGGSTGPPGNGTTSGPQLIISKERITHLGLLLFELFLVTLIIHLIVWALSKLMNQQAEQRRRAGLDPLPENIAAQIN